ncbi:hypothetical protein F383_33119 [Gossypium arboreum]|uniref:Uncharacterized protein n=1 Tax=Gossypium arboreum TaxID=29729 RepID=A0A0B0N1T9_GOSAR|nr:hypothetical protein F383_33119 [Gossypium arboreum]
MASLPLNYHSIYLSQCWNMIEGTCLTL